MTTDPRTPSFGQLLGAVSADLRALLSQTLALGRLELTAAASALTWSAVGLVVSLLIALSGVAVLVSSLVLIAVALGLPAWAAAVLVGLVLTIAGALSARHFLGQARRVEFTLRETRQSVGETLEWLKTQATR